MNMLQSRKVSRASELLLDMNPKSLQKSLQSEEQIEMALLWQRLECCRGPASEKH